MKSRKMSWAGHVALMRERRGAYRILVGKPEGRRPLGRPRRRWENNTKMDFQEVVLGARTGLTTLRIGPGGGHFYAVTNMCIP
jgi:hypothetical protein